MSGSNSSKFEGLQGLDMVDSQKGIAEAFAKLVPGVSVGWYRGIIDYQVDEAGNVTRIDELKIMSSGSERPHRVFDPEGKGQAK